MSITAFVFDRLPCGSDVQAYTMTAPSGISLTVLSYGGIMQKLLLPDREGNLRDCICGFDSILDYQNGGGYQGALIGRYGNRIEGGRFSLNGNEYRLNCNEKGVCHLHGGDRGFDSYLWNARAEEGVGEDRVILSRLSPDGEEGYPGDLSVQVTYTLTHDGRLLIDYEAESNKDTVCNLTSHTYYNLSGYDGSCVMDHLLQLESDGYDPVDELLIPTEDAPASVEGTSFDHRSLAPIASPLDHNFHLRGEARDRKLAAIYADPISRRAVKVYTDLPAVQVYTACVMDGDVAFKGGVPQRKLHAIAMETQFAPNTPNRPDQPSCVLKAGQVYRSRTEYHFGLLED